MRYNFATALQRSRSASESLSLPLENSASLPISLATFLHVLTLTVLRSKTALQTVSLQLQSALAQQLSQLSDRF